MAALLASPYSWLVAAVVALGIAFGGWEARARWDAGVVKDAQDQLKDYKAAEIKAALKQLQDATNIIADSARTYTKNTETLRGTIDNAVKDLKNVQAKNPLPAGCKPGPDRLRVIGNAVSAANAAAGQ